ncbi:unnamed protein product [Bemisia tabaci]|uniref:CIDE-N domain-containing protein n=1 Tax=Bemisia tabaci TaxID=7038 RepID=A0A9P0F467_BEMTA|nr:PREDICTED: DNA fragmentation factor subunit alpha-like [Bemisia tabaci]CAH0388224.1 unnamed protein product [Bemisia tabaci]
MSNCHLTPYKIVDVSRDKRYGIVASSLQEFISKARDKLDLGNGNVKVVLEADGTEVDEDDYFSTLENNTSLMVLSSDQKWMPAGRNLNHDDVDGGRGISSLLSRLHGDISHVSLLGGPELELLTDMDPDSLTDIIPDKTFLEQLKEASGRFLSDKRQAQDALDLLKIYHSITNIQETPNKQGRVHQ